MRKIMIGFGLAGLLLAPLAACGPAPEQAGNGGAEVTANAAPSAPAPAKAAAAPAPAALMLEGHGLRISPETELPFDTAKTATIEALTRALGRPPTERGTNEECGGGGLEYASWDGEITAWFESDRFVGWDNKGKLKTPGGIAIGSSRADLAQLQGLEVGESTLGTEFRSGGLGGILESKAPAARVTHLWGGSTCVFR